MQESFLSKVSSNSKLIRMICVILSLQLWSHVVGVSFSKSIRFVSGAVLGRILGQKSAFNNWACNSFNLSVHLRSSLSITCALITQASFFGVSSIQASFSQVSVLVNTIRPGLVLISGVHLFILSFGLTIASISYAVHKSINTSCSIGICMIRALIATE
jgi:hypothetical protein